MNTALYSLGATNKILDSTNGNAMALLKGASLLYQEILLFSGIDYCNDISEEISQGLPKKERKAAFKLFKPITKIDSRWEGTVSNWELLKDFDSWVTKKGNPLDTSFTNSLMADWLKSNSETGSQHLFLALLLSFTQNVPYHDDALNIQPFLTKLKTVTPGVTINTEMEVSIPSMDVLSWGEIFELRKSKYLDSFRHFIHQNIGVTPSEIVLQINEALWQVIGKSKPSISGSIVKRGIGQIPLPLSIPNPYSVYKDVKDGIEERKLFLNYGWLFFMQEARTKTKD